jgi:hypothetical protein
MVQFHPPAVAMLARSLVPLVKTGDFGMTLSEDI